MIFVAGTMNLKPETVDSFLADLKAMRTKVLEEDGCLHYSLLLEDAETGLVNVLEQWESYESLAVHLTQPWIGEFYAKHSGNVTASNATVYDIAGTLEFPPMPSA